MTPLMHKPFPCFSGLTGGLSGIWHFVPLGFKIIKNEIPCPFRFSQGLRSSMPLPVVFLIAAAINDPVKAA